MLYQSFVSQPAGGVNYLSLFGRAFERVSIERLDAAVAYATTGGVAALDSACRQFDQAQWHAMQKRWLVALDYCRTEPLAIRKLQELPNSTVRIHAGTEVVQRKQCTPVLPFHPKVYLLHGPTMIGAVCGSGNLSRNGLTKGHEVGNLMLTRAPENAAENLVRDICTELANWYTNTWAASDDVAAIWNAYQKAYEKRLRAPTPTEDDAGTTQTLATGRRHALDPDDLRRLRASGHLWIEAGTLTKNRGPDKPGNQLMMTPMTRVFFGFPPRDLPKDTPIGNVAITYAGQTRTDCSLVFSNNSMDKLTLPVPNDGGPSTYDQKNLLFEKQSDGTFVLTLGTNTTKARWVRASKLAGGHRVMTSGREWGVF